MAQISDERRARYRQELDQAQIRTESPFKKINWFKLQPGVTKVRVLPGIDPSSPDKDFYCKAAAHHGVSDVNPKMPVTCPKTKNPRAECPICERVEQLKKADSKADNAESERLRAKTRYYLGVVPREGEQAGKVCVYAAPKIIYTKLLSLMEDPDYGDITSPTDGHDVKLTRNGTGKDTRYDVIAVPKKSPLMDDDAETADVLANQPELWRFREAADKEEIRGFLDGSLMRFNTGGFGGGNPTSNIPLVLPVEVPTSTKPTVESGLDPDYEPPVATKKKKFGNLDEIRAELKA